MSVAVVTQQHRKCKREFLIVSRPDQKTIGAVANDLGNSLSAASYYGPPCRHRFKVDTTQALVAAGQRKNGALTHSICNVTSRLPAEKLHTSANPKLPG